MAVQLGVFSDLVLVMHDGWPWRISWVDLQRRLRCEHDPRTRADYHSLVQAVAGEHARTGADENEVGRADVAFDVERTADAQRRLHVCVRQDCATGATLECEIESRLPSNDSRRTAI